MPTTPLRERKAWRALERHHGEIAGRHLRELFAADPGARRAADGRGGRHLPRLLQEPGHRRDHAAAPGAGRGVRAASAGTRCSAASRSTSPRTGPCSTSPCACPAGASLIVDGEDVVRAGARGARPDGRFAEPGAFGRVEGLHRQADPQRGQHRHRRLRPRPGDGLRGAAPLLRPDMTFRFVSNVDSTDFVEATRDLDAEETLFIVSSKTFSTLETMTNATSARNWVVERTRRRGRGRQAFRRGVDERRARSTEFGIDTANMFGFWDWVGGRYSMDSAIGLSTMMAIGPDRFRGDAGRLPRRWTSISGPLRWREPAGADGPAGGVVRRLLRRPDGRRHALRPVPEALPRLPPAADHGVQRQARHPRRAARSTTRPARCTGASRAPTASTASTSSSTRARS